MTIPEKLAFDTKNKKTLASILLCVKPSQINHVKHLTCAMIAWNKFREIHQPKGPARKILLFKKLLHLSMPEGIAVANHLNEFCGILEGLAAIEVDIPEEMLVIILLSSLPEQYENFVVAMETRDALPSFNALKIKLLEEGARQCASVEKYEKSTEVLMQTKTSASSNFQTSVANGSGNKNKNGKNNKNSKCFNCGRRGHFAAACRQPKKSERKQESNSFERSCFMMNGKISRRNMSSTHTWYIDSGATSHLCCERSFFKNYTNANEKIWLADGQFINAVGRGDVDISGTVVTLKNVLYVPALQSNFVSVSKAIENGHTVTFERYCVEIRNNKNCVVLKAFNDKGLFMYKHDQNKCFSTALQKDAESNAFKWHNRYGHVNFSCLTDMSSNQSVFGLKLGKVPTEIVCETCAKTKINVKPFAKASEKRAKKLLSVVHSDICGPINTTSIGNSRYFATFIDDKSRYMCVYFLKTKDAIFEAFKEYKAMAEKQTGCKIKNLRSDNGREYISNVFDSYLKQHGIMRQLTVPYTPQQNGVAERANRTLVEMARAMLNYAKLGESFWAEAVKTAAYIRNRTVTKILVNKTPYELWAGMKPTVSHFKVFGSMAVALDKRQSKKFRAKGKEYIMIGYSEISKGYRLYDQESGKVIVSRDVIFFEKANDSQERNIKLIDLDKGEPESVILPIDTVHLRCNDDSCEEADSQVIDIESVEPEQGDDSRNNVQDSVVIGRGRPRLLRTGKRGRPQKLYNELNLICEDLVEAPNSVKQALNSNHCGE